MRRRIAIFCVLIILAECAAAAAARQCNHCKESVLGSDKFCPYCGQTLIVQPKPPPPMQHPVSQPVYRPVARQPQPSYCSSGANAYSNVSNGDFSFVDRLSGVGRGLATAVLSPLNVFRGMTVGVCWTAAMVEGAKIQDGQAVMYLSLLTIPVGTAFSSFAICADAINGVLDLSSAGYYGDWLYDSKASGNPTPWIWERKWNTCEVPWIERK